MVPWFTRKFGMDLLQTIILGFIQGVTEWLPISSTGHLRLAEHYFGLNVPLLFDVTLHLGTLIVILIFFRNDIRNIIEALVKLNFKTENGKLIPLIIVGTLPTIVIGFFLGNALDVYFNDTLALGAGFVACGFVLYSSRFGDERKPGITYFDALIIGTAQGIAVIPSLSRSGLTITASLLLGIRREKAFKFSFLLSVPAIIGALGLTLYEQSGALILAGIGVTEIAVGIVVSIAVSFLALKALWRVVANRKFHFFAVYCFVIGLLLVALNLTGF
jgi:undecaprenyl-diphosphatase